MIIGRWGRRGTTALVAVALIVGMGWWGWLTRSQSADNGKTRESLAIPVVTAKVDRRDVPVRLQANGSVVALQSVELRAQVTGTVREVHIKEGQFVKANELLISIDARAQDANVQKALAQVEKDESDIANAKRNLDRQQELFTQKFISQAALDLVQSRVDTLNGQLEVDRATLDAARVARAYTEVRSTFAGRTGAIGVRAGSVVQPGSAPLLTVIQIDPIAVAFTVPERELPSLQEALAKGPVLVETKLEGAGDGMSGRITFVDNTVNPATGTIRVKAEFANTGTRLWPGMFVNVSLVPRTLESATVVPAQAVQSGPDNRFVYLVGQDGKVVMEPIKLLYVAEGAAVIDGVAAGARVVVEGAQNLRPGSTVIEAQQTDGDRTDRPKQPAEPVDASGKKPAPTRSAVDRSVQAAQDS
jgi:RND family efflux transporter MFP subunit